MKTNVEKTKELVVPSVVASNLSIACVLSANSINNRRIAALTAAYSLSESALKTYKQRNKVRYAIARFLHFGQHLLSRCRRSLIRLKEKFFKKN